MSDPVSAPSSAKPAAPRPARPVFVVPDTSRRDTVIAVVVGLLVLAAVLSGINLLHNQQTLSSQNQLTGVITAKHDSGEREREVSYGRKGLKTATTDTGYSFEIRVEAEKRTYEVPVNEALYRSKNVGESQNFARPPSEQR